MEPSLNYLASVHLGVSQITSIAIGFGIWVLIGAIKDLVVALTRSTIVVQENEQVFVVVDGIRKGPLSAGSHTFKGGNLEALRFDTRIREMQVYVKEVYTQDKVVIRLNALVRYQVADAAKLVQEHQSWHARMYSDANLAMHEVVCDFDLIELLRGRSEVNQRAQGELFKSFEELGLQLRSVKVQEVILGAELKRSMAETVRLAAKGENA